MKFEIFEYLDTIKQYTRLFQIEAVKHRYKLSYDFAVMYVDEFNAKELS